MLFAIGDLHLSESGSKPMDVFGEVWADHQGRIRENWAARIDASDTVLLPGDISWAMTLDEAALDLEFIGTLAGKKVMIRGNHDYWWGGITKVRSHLPEGCFAVQNDAVQLDGLAICGTRGWLLPSHPQFKDEDGRLFHREVERLRLSLESADKTGLTKVCMIHYPPLGPLGESTPFTDLMESYGVRVCVYGHLHGHAHRFAYEGVKNGVRYQLASADYIGFDPIVVDV